MAIWLWLTMAYVLSQNKLLMQWLEAQNLEKERKKKKAETSCPRFLHPKQTWECSETPLSLCLKTTIASSRPSSTLLFLAKQKF